MSNQEETKENVVEPLLKLGNTGYKEDSDFDDILEPVPRKRKRGRPCKGDSSDGDGQDRHPMSNKERAKKSRDRKKKYTDLLEKKIEELEQQVSYLTIELDKYKKKEMYSKVGFDDVNSSRGKIF